MIVKVKNKSNAIAILLLLSNYALWLSNVLSNSIILLVIYIFIITLLWLALSVVNNNYSLKIGLKININLIFLVVFSLISFVIYRHYDNDYIKPFFFFFIIFISTLAYQNGTRLSLDVVNSSLLFYSIIFFSTIIYLIPSLQSVDIYEQTRFNSFYKSPTVFSVYITAAYLIYNYFVKNKKLSLLFYFITLFFIVVSGTRINTLLFLFFFPILFLNQFTLKLKLFWIIALIVIPLFYPIFLYFQEFINFLLNRRGGEIASEDDSTLFRIFIIWEQINVIIRSNFMEHILGHGSESCLDIFSEI
ncbi:MAG: hypothetical protein IPH28_23495 [Cytophagaceae bacterium]|nr:hypothetical protein [Cytophagaceae bacterium]